MTFLRDLISCFLDGLREGGFKRTISAFTIVFLEYVVKVLEILIDRLWENLPPIDD